MSIYTYKTQKALCEILNTEYYEDPCLSDQELDKIPEDAKWGQGSMPILYGNTHAAGNVPWNKGKDCKGIIVGNKSAHFNGESTRFKKGCVSHNKGKSPSEETKLKISKALTGRKNPEHSARMKGKHFNTTPHSDLTKKILSEKSSMYCWITDEVKTIRILKSEELPFGWRRGRTL